MEQQVKKKMTPKELMATDVATNQTMNVHISPVLSPHVQQTSTCTSL